MVRLECNYTYINYKWILQTRSSVSVAVIFVIFRRCRCFIMTNSEWQRDKTPIVCSCVYKYTLLWAPKHFAPRNTPKNWKSSRIARGGSRFAFTQSIDFFFQLNYWLLNIVCSMQTHFFASSSCYRNKKHFFLDFIKV